MTAAAGSARAWVLASRPATLTAALAPVLVGAAVARATGQLRWAPALAALAGALLIQIATNFANDVFDFEKGADTAERLGPTRATQAGLLTPREVRVGLAVTIALAVAVGVYLATVGGWPIVALGIASIVSGLAYTGGPYPLGYHGLGDVFVFVFFGLAAVCGTAYVASGALPPLAAAAAVPVGALATAVLVVNNLRDRVTDVRAGKRTLAVRLGRAGAVAEYVLLVVVAELVPVGLAIVRRSAWLALPLLTAPFAFALARAVAREEGRALNARLAATAKLLLGHAALLAAGLCLSR